MADAVFDVALDKRYTDSPELVLANVDGVDVLLIHNAADGLVYKIKASTLASFINAAISSADILDALDAPNGVAALDSGGKVPAAQLPSYVDDVLEYATASAFPGTGEAGKIYVALDTNLTYRWSGSAYVELSQSLALGETASTAYRGDRGKTAYDHSQTSGNPHGTSKADVGLGNVDNLSYAQGFNDQGSPSGATDFTAIGNFGYRFVVGTAGGPGISGATQYYSWSIGLASSLPFSQYAMQWAIPRTPVGGTPYLSVRYREGGGWGAWAKIRAGYADTAGSASSADYATTAGAITTPLENVIAPTLLNSWMNYDNTSWKQAGYYKDALGIVHLVGLVKNGTTGAAILQLPAGYRPSKGIWFAVTAGGNFGAVSIDSSGNVTHATGSNNYFSLDGIHFRAEA